MISPTVGTLAEKLSQDFFRNGFLTVTAWIGGRRGRWEGSDFWKDSEKDVAGKFTRSRRPGEQDFLWGRNNQRVSGLPFAQCLGEFSDVIPILGGNHLLV